MNDDINNKISEIENILLEKIDKARSNANFVDKKMYKSTSTVDYFKLQIQKKIKELKKVITRFDKHNTKKIKNNKSHGMSSDKASQKKLMGHSNEEDFQKKYNSKYPNRKCELVKGHKKSDVIITYETGQRVGMSLKMNIEKAIQWDMRSMNVLKKVYGTEHPLIKFCESRDNDNVDILQKMADLQQWISDNLYKFLYDRMTSGEVLEMGVKNSDGSHYIYNIQEYINYIVANNKLRCSEQQIQIDVFDGEKYRLAISIEFRSDKKSLLIRQDKVSFLKFLERIKIIDTLC